MEAARTSETLVNFYQTTRCYNPEDNNLHTHRRENLKSYYILGLLSTTTSLFNGSYREGYLVRKIIFEAGYRVFLNCYLDLEHR
jgi:hypothetical protein